MFFMLNLTLILSLMFIFMNHPLSMGMILLIQTILISLILGIINFNWWFSYILFLIMIGGMLILFIYMTSVASNEKFKFSKFILMSLLFSILIISIMYLYTQTFIIEFQFFFEEPKMFNLNKFLNYPNNLIMLMMIIYLFIVLIATVSITNMNYGPLRQIN